MYPFASRLAQIEPFHVMDVLARARALEATGRSIVHLEIGEPDFPTADSIVAAGIRALQAGHTHYTPALGLTALREAIAQSYAPEIGVGVDRVVVTPGASGALQLVFGALLSPGDEVLLADPGYPCNRHFVRLFEGVPVGIPVDASTSYQLTAELIAARWTPRTVAVLIASPSNPTGTIVSDAEMARIARVVEQRGGVLVVDEIYHGLTYGVKPSCALRYSERVFVINSFSKYYGMTGWRLGWLAAPRTYIGALDKLAQNLFLAPNTPAQYAALAALAPTTRVELDRRCDVFRERRDYLLPALRELGFKIPVEPQGAFYLYADSSAFSSDSQALALSILEKVGVAITPGLDFGVHRPAAHVRFSYANTLEKLQEAVRRMKEFLR
jgi:aspartate/methionine/tyrosine aminotransferase